MKDCMKRYMKRLRIWIENAYHIVVGSLLWLIGGGGIERGCECMDCGAILPDSDAARDFHLRTCHSEEE